ncbi:MAG: hypothetical protein HY290_03600 [Planctomycetia bacterium]|nr:hypothetical protein [Planctomycetia bacterium]
MGKRVISPVAWLLFASFVYCLIVVGAIWTLGGEAWSLLGVVMAVVVAAAGPFLGAAVIWIIVRRTNRHGEERPSEPGT